ncbi:MAG: HAD family phosphatase, partial [Verrucomicrobiales bacterium]|nr:HAD family phosphatase [Verrucomicrobiales bacterium]
AVNADRTEYVVRHHKEVLPIDPVVDFARSLEGKLPMAVASGSEAEIVESTLQNITIRHLFTTVITPDDVAPGRGKPAPDMFLLAAERMGVPPGRCLVFEDGQNGIDAAVAAGMASVFVPRPA